MLHFNELPLRRLFRILDGVTKSPKLFIGPIGKKLTACETEPIVRFKRVSSDNLPVLPESVVDDLSCDQKYLYNMCHAIQAGTVSPSLAMNVPGTLNHSRFLTTANRILRYYVSKSKPSKKLITIVDFYVKVYAPMWFSIKSQGNIRMGPKLLFDFIKWVRENFKSKLRKELFKAVKINSYFAHPENILLTMLTDENKTIRELAVNSILAARVSNNAGIRTFVKPKIDFTAKNYHEMVNIYNIEPPITKNRSEECLRECINTAENWIKKNINGIPVHTQAVERSIKLVSSVSSQVVGEQNRNQLISLQSHRDRLFQRQIQKKII